MAMKGLLDPGDVDDTQQVVAQRVEDGGGRASPVLDVDAVVFAGVDLYRLVGRNAGADLAKYRKLVGSAANGAVCD